MNAVVDLVRTPALVGAGDVADHLGISKSTVYQLAKTNQIPHRRIGKLVRFDLAEIDRWVAQQHHGPNV